MTVRSPSPEPEAKKESGFVLSLLDEPELEFGSGRHIDIRFGLTNYGPLDLGTALAPAEIRVGIVGTAETVTGIRDWLERSATGVPAKESPHPYLFPAFPGLSEESSFRTKLVFSDQLERTIRERDIVNLARHGRAHLTSEAVDLFMAEMRDLTEATKPDVLVCALPWNLLDLLREPETQSNDDPSEAEELTGGPAAAEAPDFHHLLKARAMALRIPLQLVKPSTYGHTRKDLPRPELQDEATRAWNFFTALYYKAGGKPWRLPRLSSALTTCYVGVAFYDVPGKNVLSTSLAQVFNERGDGVVIRGAAARISKEDRRPHLDEDDARALLKDALDLYRREHKNLPARIVLFKTSRHNTAEVTGFTDAATDHGVHSLDLVSIRRSSAKLFRRGAYPPLRGTLLRLDCHEQILYTRGSVPFFTTYPGMYVPYALALRLDAGDSAPKELAMETLALTKMNWNNTQFDGFAPITIRAARQVGNILKYVGPDDPIVARYANYI